MTKRLTALALAILLCLALVGCSNDGAPDGMFSATLDGEPFILYVPEGWTDNCSSGISSAYYSATDLIAATARYYTPEDAETTLDAYVELCLERYDANAEGFKLVESRATVLGGVDARELIFVQKHDNQQIKLRQIIVKYGSDFISLTMYAPTEKYDDNSYMFDMIVEEFVLCQRTEPVNDCVTDKKTPEGMKIASPDNVEYRLYVPTTWVCDSQSKKAEAYFPESGRPNVTVTSYSPDEELTPQTYFEKCEKEYKDALEGYELILTEERTVAQRQAVSYTYKATVGGVELRLMQTVLVYNGMVYSITYTALDDSFDAHTDDVNAMLDAFIFR